MGPGSRVQGPESGPLGCVRRHLNVAAEALKGGEGDLQCPAWPPGTPDCLLLENVLAGFLLLVLFVAGTAKLSHARLPKTRRFLFFFLFCPAGGGEVATMPASSARTVVVDPVLSLPLNGFLRLGIAAASLSVV